MCVGYVYHQSISFRKQIHSASMIHMIDSPVSSFRFYFLFLIERKQHSFRYSFNADFLLEAPSTNHHRTGGLDFLSFNDIEMPRPLVAAAIQSGRWREEHERMSLADEKITKVKDVQASSSHAKKFCVVLFGFLVGCLVNKVALYYTTPPAADRVS